MAARAAQAESLDDVIARAMARAADFREIREVKPAIGHRATMLRMPIANPGLTTGGNYRAIVWVRVLPSRTPNRTSSGADAPTLLTMRSQAPLTPPATRGACYATDCMQRYGL